MSQWELDLLLSVKFNTFHRWVVEEDAVTTWEHFSPNHLITRAESVAVPVGIRSGSHRVKFNTFHRWVFEEDAVTGITCSAPQILQFHRNLNSYEQLSSAVSSSQTDSSVTVLTLSQHIAWLALTPTMSPQWGTKDAEIKVPFLENPQLANVLLLKPG